MDQGTNSESRRKFLKTAGKFAVYTPPALMVMSKSSAASIAKSGGGYPGNSGGSQGGSTGGSQNCGNGTLAELFCQFFK